MPQRAVEIAVAASARNPIPAAKAANTTAHQAATVPASAATEGAEDMRFRIRNAPRDPEPGAGSAAPPSREQILAQVHARNQELSTITAPFMARAGVRELYDAALIDPSMSVEAFRQRVLDHLGRDATPAWQPSIRRTSSTAQACSA